MIARHNERLMLDRGAVEIDRRGYKFIVLMHAAFPVSILAESVMLNRTLSQYWQALGAVFILAQALRYWAISSLGKYWNTKIIVAPDHVHIKKGPYKYLRHPNYAAVVAEIAVIPLIFSCYITAVVFTMINALLLMRRVRLEADALGMGRD